MKVALAAQGSEGQPAASQQEVRSCLLHAVPQLVHLLSFPAGGQSLRSTRLAVNMHRGPAGCPAPPSRQQDGLGLGGDASTPPVAPFLASCRPAGLPDWHLATPCSALSRAGVACRPDGLPDAGTIPLELPGSKRSSCRRH